MSYDRVASISRLGAIVAVLVLAAVGCNARPQALPNTGLPVASQIGSDSTSSNNGWPTFAYDYTRSGFNPSVTNLTPSNVSKLTRRWKQNVGDEIFASPVTYAGNLIVVTVGSRTASLGSVVYDFSTSDGKLLWKYAMGGKAKMTPTIDPSAGLVIVGRQSSEPYLYALHLLDGTVAWSRKVRGLLRAAPVVAGGVVYIGRSGGDPPACTQGGVSAYNETTGKLEWDWAVDPTRHEGGSVWGAISYDGTNLIFGTGNTCQTPVTTANGAVSLKLDGSVAWNMVAVKDSSYDADTGGGVMLLNGRAHFINKNGRFYALNEETGNIVWKSDLNPLAGPPSWKGGFASPTTDGSTTILVGSGLYKGSSSGSGADLGGEFCMLNVAKPTEVFKGFHSELQAMNLSGNVIWTREMQNRLVGYVALAQGLGFVGLNENFEALDLKTGKTLWSYATPDYIDASMIVVPSGLYGADDAGNVYAFTLPTPSGHRRHGARVRE
jgi:outer membrane protein assembly factor BamB